MRQTDKRWDNEPIINRGSLGIPAKECEIRTCYFNHLCDLVGLNGYPGNTTLNYEESGSMTYFLLANHLHSKEFIPIFPNDDNRLKEGLQLRKNFALYSSAFEDYSCLEKLPCSFLELFVALAIAIDTDVMCSPDDDYDRSADWFWVMMNNMQFDEFVDTHWDVNAANHVNHILDNINKRSMNFDGSGGIFPLKNPPSDQRTTEIWYQMQAFFIENYDELDLIGRKFGVPPRE